MFLIYAVDVSVNIVTIVLTITIIAIMKMYVLSIMNSMYYDSHGSYHCCCHSSINISTVWVPYVLLLNSYIYIFIYILIYRCIICIVIHSACNPPPLWPTGFKDHQHIYEDIFSRQVTKPSTLLTNCCTTSDAKNTVIHGYFMVIHHINRLANS